MMKQGPKAPGSGAPQESSAQARKQAPAARSAQATKAERRLMSRVFKRCGGFIRAACAASSVPPEFLGALVANESGGNPRAARFEPLVYRHLCAVAKGAEPVYAMLRAHDLATEVDDMLHPKSDDFHTRFLTTSFGANHEEEFAALADEALRELATSWGYTQIMGYHMVGRGGTVRDLLDPAFHFHTALQLLAEFADEYQLNLAHEFEEMFRCWNTGKPYGRTFDPGYVAHGLARMEEYRDSGSGVRDSGPDPELRVPGPETKEA
jgi:hypothetical protein